MWCAVGVKDLPFLLGEDACSGGGEVEKREDKKRKRNRRSEEAKTRWEGCVPLWADNDDGTKGPIQAAAISSGTRYPACLISRHSPTRTLLVSPSVPSVHGPSHQSGCTSDEFGVTIATDVAHQLSLKLEYLLAPNTSYVILIPPQPVTNITDRNLFCNYRSSFSSVWLFFLPA